MRNLIFLLCFVVGFVIAVEFESSACNPKGSLAAEINWAGHKVCDE